MNAFVWAARPKQVQTKLTGTRCKMKVEGNAILINTGDIIRMDIGDRIRVWRVTGIYLGSVREEDLIGIECLDMYHGGGT